MINFEEKKTMFKDCFRSATRRSCVQLSRNEVRAHNTYFQVLVPGFARLPAASYYVSWGGGHQYSRNDVVRCPPIASVQGQFTLYFATPPRGYGIFIASIQAKSCEMPVKIEIQDLHPFFFFFLLFLSFYFPSRLVTIYSLSPHPPLPVCPNSKCNT